MPNVQSYLTHEELQKFRLACKVMNMNESQFLKYIILKEIKSIKTKNV